MRLRLERCDAQSLVQARIQEHIERTVIGTGVLDIAGQQDVAAAFKLRGKPQVAACVAEEKP